MTISSALAAGVAGLNANATRLATISDNIANSGTYGYKRAATEFESMVITQQSGSGMYSAGGVRATATRMIDERGALVSTANALDLAVSGRGMIPVTRWPVRRRWPRWIFTGMRICLPRAQNWRRIFWSP